MRSVHDVLIERATHSHGCAVVPSLRPLPAVTVTVARHILSGSLASPYDASTSQSPALMAGPSGLCNYFGHLVDLSLRAAERAEPLLREFASTLVLGVAEQFDYAAFVWGEAMG